MVRFGKKKRHEKAAPKVFDPSPLIGDVDLTSKDIKVYLVKMPRQLANQFEDPSKGVVGRMRFPDDNKLAEASDPNKPKKGQQLPEIFLDKIADSSDGADTISRQFELHTLQAEVDNPNIFVFSTNPDQEKDETRMEGSVSHMCQARPVMTNAFRMLNKHRSYNMNQNTSRMQHITESKRKQADLVVMRPSAMTETNKEREERKRQKEESRRHLDVPDGEWLDETRTHVFKAFEIQPYYTADELARTLSETTTRLRPVISELCSYNKSAPFAGKYELKDEYKTVEQRKQKEDAIAEHRQLQAEIIRKRKEERSEREKAEGAASKKQRTI